MKRNPLIALFVLAACLFRLSVPANDIEPSKEFYTVFYAPNPIVLDGNLSEWTGVPVLADPKFAVPKYSGTNPSPNYVLFEEYDGGTWSGPDDQTSAVQIVYDADNVYFGFVVTDDYHENISGNAWNGDSVQLMIADATRTVQVALYNYALGGYENNAGMFVPDPNLPDPVIIHHEAGPGGTEAVVARNSVTKKTTYEIKLPKAALGLTTLKGGPQFGLGMAINDGDGALVDGTQYGQAGQEGQKGWGGLGAHSIVFGKTPSETALATLVKGNDIEPSKEYYTALRTTNAIVLDGDFSEWSGAPVLADPKFAIPKYSGTNDSPNYVLFEEYDGGTWSGPDDQTSAVQVVYDEENVYFGFVVTDDYHENISGNAWNGDSVQLMIADATRTVQVALYNYALGGYENNADMFVPDPNLPDPVIIHHEAGPGGTEAVVTRDSVNNKTRYEIRLPVAALGLTAPLSNGIQFGLGMAINDGDGALVDGTQYGQAGQEGQKGWGGLGAHSIVFGKTPSETALVTLGSTVSGADRLFLSAINPAIDSFSFRANDKGSSIVDPTSARLTVDGQMLPLTASPKIGDATDFSYRPVPPFAAGMHTYSIEVRDTQGNAVTDAGSFLVPVYPMLTTADQAVSVNTNEPGFIWRLFQNAAFVATNLAAAEAGLAGQAVDEFGFPLDNLATPTATGVALGPATVDGPLFRFEIPSVINLSQIGGEFNGVFTPDDQMPGIPGNGDDGIAGELLTFVEFPAGLITMGVASDDGFRVQAGYTNSSGMVLGESEFASTNIFRFVVQFPGVYPLRAIWFEYNGLANIEWFTVKGGTNVLLNDVANGGLRTFRAGVPSSGFKLAVQRTGGQIVITWSEPGTMLQESTDLTNWNTLATATSPYQVMPGARAFVFYRLVK